MCCRASWMSSRCPQMPGMPRGRSRSIRCFAQAAVVPECCGASRRREYLSELLSRAGQRWGIEPPERWGRLFRGDTAEPVPSACGAWDLYAAMFATPPPRPSPAARLRRPRTNAPPPGRVHGCRIHEHGRGLAPCPRVRCKPSAAATSPVRALLHLVHGPQPQRFQRLVTQLAAVVSAHNPIIPDHRTKSRPTYEVLGKLPIPGLDITNLGLSLSA